MSDEVLRAAIERIRELEARLARLERIESLAGVVTSHSHSKLVASDGDPDPAISTDAVGYLSLLLGVGVSEFSTDGTLSGNSDLAVPTEKAVKTYVDALGAGPSWKLVPEDGAPDPSFWVDQWGDAFSVGDLTLGGWLTAMPGISTNYIDGGGTAMDINECFSVSYDCVAAGEHSHDGFTIFERIFFYSDRAVNTSTWTTLDGIGMSQTGIYIVNGVSDTSSANSRFQAMVYYARSSAGVDSTIEIKVGAANGSLQISGGNLQCKALHEDLNRVSTIGIESFHL